MNYDLIFSSQNKGLKRNFLVQKLKRTIDLPVLPDILNNLDRMLSNPDVTVQQISELINADPVIAGRVLNMANSAYYCAGRKIVSNIDLAVSRLGFKVIRALVYSAVLPDLFKEITELDHLQFWKHSMTVALLSRYLIESEDGYKIEDADRAYLCGLMHDIGILVFYSILGDKYSELIQSNQEDGWGLHRIEEDEFVLNHADVGSLFVDLHWEVDPKIVDVFIREVLVNLML